MTFIQGAQKIKGVILRGDFSAIPSEYSSWKMGLEFTENNPSKVLVTSGAVETVYDQSGNSRDFSQSTALARPIFTAGVGAGFVSNDSLVTTSNLITDSEGTVMAIVRMDRLNDNEFIFSKGDATVADGNAVSMLKNTSANGNTMRTQLATGAGPGITASLAITDTSTFRVYTFQKNKIFINTMEQDISVTNRIVWFNDPTGGTQRMSIGKTAGTSTSFTSVITIKELHYFNVTLANQDVVKLVNGLREKHNI